MPSCDWGRPCDCRECTDMHRKDICDICNKNKTITTHSEYETGRKGISYYNFTNYCHKCWDDKRKKDEIERQEHEKELLKKKEKRRKLMIVLDKLDYNPIPIKYAVAKYREQIGISNSDRWIRDHIINMHKKTLRIKKTNNRWYCCKNRLELMNFKLYYS